MNNTSIRSHSSKRKFNEKRNKATCCWANSLKVCKKKNTNAFSFRHGNNTDPKHKPFFCDKMDDDKLVPLPTSTLEYGSTNGNGTSKLHMQTYTAGEDKNRLAEMAKEFGLQHQRQPRRQVRERVSTPLSSLTEFFHERFLHPDFADVRMRAIFTQHDHPDDDQEGRELMGRPPRWQEDVGTGGEAPKGGDLTSAVLGIIKGMVGPAILYLPHAFANAGWAVALPILILSTVLFLSSSACLLDAWKLESTKSNNNTNMLLPNKKPKRTILSYPELAHRALGSTGEMFVKIGIALMQSGVVLTYLIFVPQNLKVVTNIVFGYDLDPSYFIIIMLIYEIPMSWVRDIRKLTVTNLLANALILYGLITCLGFAFSDAIKNVDGRGPMEEIMFRFTNLDTFNSSGWFLFIGTSVLLFEGTITLLVPLQEAVYREEDREKFPIVYQKVIMCIICFYSVFGIFCWMSFGDDVSIVMTTSLPQGKIATTVQLAYSIAVIFTFPLQNFPSLEIATRSIATAMDSTCGKPTKYLQNRNVIASAIVCILALVAVVTMNSLDKVVSLMGGMLGCPLAFIFPPLIHNNLDPNLSEGRRRYNWAIAGFGVCAMVVATVTTLASWS
jgi:proton-coupled amino acid transporter